MCTGKDVSGKQKKRLGENSKAPLLMCCSIHKKNRLSMVFSKKLEGGPWKVVEREGEGNSVCGRFLRECYDYQGLDKCGTSIIISM